MFQDAFGGINWVDGTKESLDKLDLKDFAAIYLINVDSLTEGQRDKLENYTRAGGGGGLVCSVASGTGNRPVPPR